MNRPDAAYAFASLSTAAFHTMAQQPPTAARVGFLYFGSRQAAIDTGRYEACRKGMKELGYVEGANLSLDARFADGNASRLGEIVSELLKLKPDVIVATGQPSYGAL